MADDINSDELPLTIFNGLFLQPTAKALPLSINRKLGSSDSYNYIYAGKLPLRIEKRIKDRPLSGTLPLSINRPYNTLLPARYVSAKAMPLEINTSIANRPQSKALPLTVDKELGTLTKEENVKPKAQDVSPISWVSSVNGLSSLRFIDRKLLLVGINSSLYGQLTIRAEVAEGYFPSSRLKLPIAVDRSIRPPSSELALSIYREHGQWLNRPDIKPINRRYIYPKTFIGGAVAAPNISLYQKYAQPNGVDGFVAGTPVIKNGRDFVALTGWHSSQLSNSSSIVNRNQRVTIEGWVSSTTATPKIYNLKQFLGVYGYDQSLYGNAYLIGGLKYLEHYGHNSNAIGWLVVTNTTADQQVKPEGIKTPDLLGPIVSPRILYVTGINSLSVGVPAARDPSLKPLGETHATYGKPTIWFHTRPLAPGGILSYESGYLRIADPAQFALVPSLIESAIFGDTAIKNTSTGITVSGIDELSFSDYATLTNSNRTYAPKGINSLSIGTAAIKNKTPSIFVDSIGPYDVGLPAIGHAIRYVEPTGFDHLLFGRAVLTKTPEIFPIGHQSSTAGQAWISHKNRSIDLSQKGIDSFKAGNQAVWYGQRPFRPIGWQSGSYGQPTLTHQLRTVLAQGFIRDAYGSPWASPGTRALEPQGIYKDFPSNHMVGGTQTIKPVGYEATLWGERIIPISQSVQPLGFTGLWGNTLVDLHTKYVAPVGYISVGQQPADRWGSVTAFNKTQYITQEFDINSGLVPPKWSDYLLIANRNIEMKVTGHSSQRFGYSQIDNNAAPILPEAITPPPITIGMISHGIRSIAPEAIEPIPISQWGVVYNGARVIAPPGVIHTGSGQPVVANTRRYYSGVGRFESLETGTPTIGHAIRTIDIEPRYSIAPPQINLPTVELYTRYVGFNGYETVKYGLPSLSIHFNIIGPSWNHRDDFGNSAVRNATPELLVGAFDSQEFGNAGIRTQWRHIQAQGDTATLFGTAKAADRKQSVAVPGWQDSASSQKHTVTKTGAPPYTPQNIWLQNESDPSKNGYGIEPTSTPAPPGINQNVIYAHGYNSQKFGDTFVYSNNLYIDIGISTKNIEKGPTVTNKKRYLNPAGINNEIKVSKDLQVTPFYIKPKGFNHETDGITFSQTKIGKPIVTNQHRSIYHVGHSSSNVGYGLRVSLKTRYVEPPTIRGYAMGFPEIPFTPKTVILTDYGFLSEAHGLTAIAYPPYTGPQTISATGFNVFGTGSSRVELLNREIQAVGKSSLQMGTSIQNDSPYMWQGLRIGEFVPMSIGAGDTSSFGEARIGLRVREIPVEGFVAFRSEYEPIRFKDRMKVIGTITDNVKSQGIVVGGISSQAMGSTGVKLGQYFIRPDGNSDQFRKSSYSAECGAPTISG